MNIKHQTTQLETTLYNHVEKLDLPYYPQVKFMKQKAFKMRIGIDPDSSLLHQRTIVKLIVWKRSWIRKAFVMKTLK